MHAPVFYQPSKKVSTSKLPVALAMGLGMSLVVGGIFGLLTRYNPLSYIPLSMMGIHVGTIGSLLWWAAAAFCTFIVGGVVIRSANVRNPTVGLLLGTFVGVATVYIHWAVFTSLMAGFAILPHHIIDFQNALVDMEYSAFGLLEAPGINWIFWTIEGLGVVAAGALAGHTEALAVFCETCEEWADDEKVIDFPLSLGHELLQAKLQAGDFDAISNAEKYDNIEVYRYRLTFKSCPICDNTHAIDLEALSFVFDDEGEVEEKTEMLMERLVLSKTHVDDLLSTVVPPVSGAQHAAPEVDDEGRIHL